MMLDLQELKLHIRYDSETGECFRIGYRDRLGVYIRIEEYKITGVTKKGKYGYCRVSVLGNRYVVHKLAYFYHTGIWPDTIDHVNGDCSDNRFVNLRNTDRFGNMSNLKLRKDNPTGYIGVAFKKELGKFYAHAQKDNERYFAGYFLTIEEAVDARNKLTNDLDFHENHGTR